MQVESQRLKQAQMRPDNYMCFSLVLGFFIGIALGIMKFDEPVFVLLWTIIASLGCYLICIFCIALLFKNMDFEVTRAKKHALEHDIDVFVRELDKQDAISSEIREFIRGIEMDVEDELGRGKEQAI